MNMKHAAIKISEIEKDYKHFIEVIIPKIETVALKLVANYCKGNKKSLCDLFFGEEEVSKGFNDTLNTTKGKGQINENSSDMSRVKSQIHIFTLYSVEEKVSQFYLKKKNENYVKDFKLLFNLFALQSSNDDKTTIPFNHIYRVSHGTEVKKIKDLSDPYLD